MSTFKDQMYQQLDIVVKKFCAHLATKYELDEDALYQEFQGSKQKQVSSEKRSVSKVMPDAPTCQYVFSKGKKAGQECGARSKDGWCSEHKKHADKPPREPKILPRPLKSMKPGAKKASTAKKLNPIIRKHANYGLWHEETGFIFDSDKTVTSRCVKDKVRDIEDDDMADLKKWSFRLKKLKKKDPVQNYVSLTCNEGGCDKFWKGVVNDCEFTVTYGKSGSSGRTTTKTLKSHDKAVEAFNKVVKAKKKKGYTESETPKPVDPDSDSSDDEEEKKVVKKAPKPVDPDSDSSDDEEEVKVVKKAPKPVDPDSDSSDDEEEVKVVKKAPKPVYPDSDSSDDEEKVKPSTKKGSIPGGMSTDSDSDVDEADDIKAQVVKVLGVSDDSGEELSDSDEE